MPRPSLRCRSVQDRFSSLRLAFRQAVAPAACAWDSLIASCRGSTRGRRELSVLRAISRERTAALLEGKLVCRDATALGRFRSPDMSAAGSLRFRPITKVLTRRKSRRPPAKFRVGWPGPLLPAEAPARLSGGFALRRPEEPPAESHPGTSKGPRTARGSGFRAPASLRCEGPSGKFISPLGRDEDPFLFASGRSRRSVASPGGSPRKTGELRSCRKSPRMCQSGENIFPCARGVQASLRVPRGGSPMEKLH